MKKLDLYNKQTLFYKEFNKKVDVQFKKKKYWFKFVRC